MPRPAAAALPLAALLCLGLGGCAGKEAPDLTARVLFTANGSYDAQSDLRDRIGGGLRRVVWNRRPPLAARAVTVRFDGNARPATWEMVVEAPGFRAADLAGEGARRVGTPQGEALRPGGERLKNVLILEAPGRLRLLSRGWAAQEEPALYSAFSE